MSLIRGLDQLDGEEELYGADEEAAQVQRQSEGAQRQSHLVDYRVLLRADQTTRRDC